MMYSEFDVKENKKKKFILSNKPMLTKISVLVLLFIFAQSIRYVMAGRTESPTNTEKNKNEPNNSNSQTTSKSAADTAQQSRKSVGTIDNSDVLEEAKHVVMSLTDRVDQVYHQLKDAKKMIATSSNRGIDDDPKGCASPHELRYWNEKRNMGKWGGDIHQNK
jgi:hypothetical protein